jgi:molecular chaperone DnaK (HSP70)
MRGLLHAIDFGTSNSSIIVSEPDGTETIIPDPAGLAGSESIPTSVCVRHDGSIQVGTAAERAKNLDPAAYRSEFKRDFGDPTPTTLAGRSMTPDELTTEILRFLRKQAQEAIPGDPELVVITVPASWESGNRELMRSAAQRAGYGSAVIELIAEPIAALADAFRERQNPAENLTMLVYDLGGGTFDCAVARGTADGYEVLGRSGGLDEVGGSAFDRLLLGLVRERFTESAASVLDAPADDVDLLRRWLSLKDTCERLKQRLSGAKHAEDLLNELLPPQWFGLDRAEFEALIRTALGETIAECDRMLDDLRLAWPGVDRIVPVGGSSRIPLVGQILAEHSGRPVLAIDRVDTAVAYGAARFGRDLLKEQRSTVVFVNGRRKAVHVRQLGFEELLRLAFGDAVARQAGTVTVTYERAAGAKATGSLIPGRAVKVQDGTIFNVTATDKS